MKACLACGEKMPLDADVCPFCHLAGQNQLFLSKEDYEKWEQQVLRPHQLSLNPTQVFARDAFALILMGNGDLFITDYKETRQITYGVKHAAIGRNGLIACVSFGGLVDVMLEGATDDMWHKGENELIRRFQCPFRASKVYISSGYVNPNAFPSLTLRAPDTSLWIESEDGNLYYAGHNVYTTRNEKTGEEIAYPVVFQRLREVKEYTFLRKKGDGNPWRRELNSLWGLREKYYAYSIPDEPWYQELEKEYGKENLKVFFHKPILEEDAENGAKRYVCRAEVIYAPEWIYQPMPYSSCAEMPLQVCREEDEDCVLVNGLPLVRGSVSVPPDAVKYCTEYPPAYQDASGCWRREKDGAPLPWMPDWREMILLNCESALIITNTNEVFCSDDIFQIQGDRGEHFRKLEFFKYCPDCMEKIPRESDCCPQCGAEGLKAAMDTRKDWLAQGKTPLPAKGKARLIGGDYRDKRLYALTSKGNLYRMECGWSDLKWIRIAHHVADLQQHDYDWDRGDCWTFCGLTEDGRLFVEKDPHYYSTFPATLGGGLGYADEDFSCSFPVKRIQGASLWDQQGRKHDVAGILLEEVKDPYERDSFHRNRWSVPTPRRFSKEGRYLEEGYHDDGKEVGKVEGWAAFARKTGISLAGAVKSRKKTWGGSEARIYSLNDQHVFCAQWVENGRARAKLTLPGVRDFEIATSELGIKTGRQDFWDDILCLLTETEEFYWIDCRELFEKGWEGLKLTKVEE